MNEIAGAVAALLVHYWTANDDEVSRRLQVADWIQDLWEFPLDAIEGAIIAWRRTESRRPTPADIRRLILPAPPSEAAAAYTPLPKSRLSQRQLQKHRHNQVKYWDLVRRAQAGEDPELLIAERKRMTAGDYVRDPELKVIDDIVRAEEQAEKGGIA